MKLLFCGDFMPGGVLPYQEEYFSRELFEYMAGFDFRVCTLEAAIGSNFPFDEVKMQGRQNIIFARDEDLFRVKELGIDVVSLANNHTMDLGEDGLLNTIYRLESSGIKYCGAGKNNEEASRPVVLEKDGSTVAIFAYCECGNELSGAVKIAGDFCAGVNPLNLDKVIQDIESAKQMYDYVVIMPHWGCEYSYYPLEEHVSMAKKMISVGADAIIGSHTHQIQPMLKYQGKPICFSLANFLFPDFCMCPPRPIGYPPTKADVEKLDKVIAYPFPIKEPVVRVWHQIARYGRIVAIHFSQDKCNTDSYYTYTNGNNVVDFGCITFKMKCSLLLATASAKYQLCRKMIDFVRKIKRIGN